MNMHSRLGLGTVQWGMSYGIANRSGQPTPEQVGEMLLVARESGVTLLDTSYAYGDAERVLGELAVDRMGFQIVTKTKAIRAEEITDKDIRDVTVAFHESLTRLGCRQVYGLLVHGADALLVKAGERLWKALEELKSAGAVGKIGVSVYHPRQLESILDRYSIDLVQLPFNIYDQRFKQSGLLDRLKCSDIEVHSRSAFLQGLLLLPPERLPMRFHGIRAHHTTLYRHLQDLGFTPSESCLLYCLQQSAINRIVIGCETSTQLQDILRILNGNWIDRLVDLDSFKIEDEIIINPSAWNQ